MNTIKSGQSDLAGQFKDHPAIEQKVAYAQEQLLKLEDDIYNEEKRINNIDEGCNRE